MGWVFWLSLLFTVWFVLKYRRKKANRRVSLPSTVNNEVLQQPRPEEPVHYIHRAPPVQEHRVTPPVPHRAPAPFEIRQMEEQMAMLNDIQSRRALKHSPLSDPQNVHDSSVVKSIKASLNKLPHPRLSVSDSIQRARELCKDNHRALQTIDRMQTNTLPLLSLGMREAEVLQKVVSAIPDNDNDKEAMLVLELQDAADTNSCASGRVARVVGTLCALDERVSIVPTWALKQEILATASTLNTHDEDVIKSALYKAYVEPGLATTAFIDKEVASWGL